MRRLAGYPPPLAEAPCNSWLDRVCLCVILSLCPPKITARAVSSFHTLCRILCSFHLLSFSLCLSLWLAEGGLYVCGESLPSPVSKISAAHWVQTPYLQHNTLKNILWAHRKMSVLGIRSEKETLIWVEYVHPSLMNDCWTVITIRRILTAIVLSFQSITGHIWAFNRQVLQWFISSPRMTGSWSVLSANDLVLWIHYEYMNKLITMKVKNDILFLNRIWASYDFKTHLKWICNKNMFFTVIYQTHYPK